MLKTFSRSGPRLYLALVAASILVQALTFAASGPRATADGRFDGILHSALSPRYFERFFKEVVPFSGHSALLARADGSILARDPPAASGKLPPDAALMQAIADQPTAGAYT